MLKSTILLGLSTLLFGEIQNYQLHSKLSLPLQEGKIKLLDAKELDFGKKFNELSAIDYKDKKLYALNDKGYLFYMSLELQENKIKSLSLDKTLKLKSGKKKKKMDTEGLVFRDDFFYISFERKPKVEKYSLDGKQIKTKKINKDLKKVKNYQNKNKGLEAIAYSKKYGIITAPEIPLKNNKSRMHALYGDKETYYFPFKAALSSMAFMSKNKLLLIQRDYDKKTFKAKIYLTRVNLNKCVDGVCSSEVLASFKTKDGWNLDNFEGLAQVDEKRFIMISDNNENPKQKTLLVLFEVLD